MNRRSLYGDNFFAEFDEVCIIDEIPDDYHYSNLELMSQGHSEDQYHPEFDRLLDEDMPNPFNTPTSDSFLEQAQKSSSVTKTLKNIGGSMVSPQPLFSNKSRPPLNIQVSKKSEVVHDSIWKGDKEETKSLHKNIRTELMNFFRARVLAGDNLSEEQVASIAKYDTGSASFGSMAQLLGFNETADGTITEDSKHDTLKEMCLKCTSGHDLIKGILMSKSHVVQKLTRLKYINVAEQMVIEAPNITKWK